MPRPPPPLKTYLAPYLPQHLGIDVATFLADMQDFLRPVLRAADGERVEFPFATRPLLRDAGESAPD